MGATNFFSCLAQGGFSASLEGIVRRPEVLIALIVVIFLSYLQVCRAGISPFFKKRKPGIECKRVVWECYLSSLQPVQRSDF